MRSARILDKGIKSRTIRKRRREEKDTNRRLQTIVFLVAAIVILSAVTVAGIMTEGYAAETDFSRRNLAPDLQHPFGTDWMGRDMLARTLAGLSLSIRIGVLTAAVSAAVALLLGTASVVFGRKADAVISTYLARYADLSGMWTRICRSGGRSFVKPLAISGKSDPGRTHTASAGAVHTGG